MLQILGICRFAYPGLGGFQVDHGSVAEREAHLFAPARMEARLRALEHVCIASLRAQTDPEFRLLVITGETLPAPYLARLRAILAPLPQAELIQFPAMNQRNAMEEIVNARIDQSGPPVMQFRMDDDDGVARKFIARARETFGQVRPLWAAHKRLCLDFNRGYYLRLTAQGADAAPVLRHQLGVAQALFLDPSIRRTAIHFPHHRLPTLMPFLSITDAPMWLRGIDGMNDSDLDPASTNLPPATPEIAQDLEARFGLDLARIQASF